MPLKSLRTPAEGIAEIAVCVHYLLTNTVEEVDWVTSVKWIQDADIVSKLKHFDPKDLTLEKKQFVTKKMETEETKESSLAKTSLSAMILSRWIRVIVKNYSPLH